MTNKLRILLFLASLATMAFFLNKIRNRKIKINHSIFWLIFGILLLVFSMVPSLVDLLSAAFGIYSTPNFVFLFMIFLLVVKSFTDTVKLSKLSEQVTALTQSLALSQKALEMEEAKRKGEHHE